MMKIYYAHGGCSQAVHILLHEAQFDHTSERVDLRAKRTAGGADYWAINPKGAVPALDLGHGEVLTGIPHPARFGDYRQHGRFRHRELRVIGARMAEFQRRRLHKARPCGPGLIRRGQAGRRDCAKNSTLPRSTLAPPLRKASIPPSPTLSL